MKGPAPSGWRVWTGRVLLGASVLVSAFFFVSRWAINAPGLGARDAGLALALSFANPLSLYACVVLGTVSAIAALIAAFSRRPFGMLASGALISFLPLAYLAILG